MITTSTTTINPVFTSYPYTNIPEIVVTTIAAELTYLKYVGQKDITGLNFEQALAAGVHGRTPPSARELIDVVSGNIGWSAKTVKTSNKKIFSIDHIPLISGRISLVHRFGVFDDATVNPQKAGDLVIDIFNERIQKARETAADVRTSVLVRSEDLSSFVIFEKAMIPLTNSDYTWSTTDRNNICARAPIKTVDMRLRGSQAAANLQYMSRFRHMPTRLY